MEEVDLLQRPKAKRTFDANWRKRENKVIARRFDKEFFDGDRANGYGGYTYDGRWIKVAERIKEKYGLNENSSFLDVGCGKGFLMHDLKQVIPGIKVAGLDISEYAINNGMDDVKPFMIIASEDKLPYADNSFDFVFCCDTIHNLPIEKCKNALEEMRRVCKPDGNMFVRVDAWKTEQEKNNFLLWNLTALTYMSTDDWIEFFKESGYDGDYYWTIMRNEDE